jgi:hypothetical protein
MTRRIPQIILALAILTPYTSLHSQSKKAFNGYDLVDKDREYSQANGRSRPLPVSRNLHSHRFQW